MPTEFEYLTRCNWCDWEGYMHPTAQECPSCHSESYLMDVEEESGQLILRGGHDEL